MATTKKPTEVEEVKEELDPRAGAVPREEFEHNAYPFEMVKRRYPKSRTGRESKDIWVSVNGKTHHIMRGEEIEIPYYVALAADNSAYMYEAADKFVESLAK